MKLVNISQTNNGNVRKTELMSLKQTEQKILEDYIKA
jgi:hypothetical protein